MNTEELREIDGDDLEYALSYRSKDVTKDAIAGIVAEVPGANDEYNWHWIVKMVDGRYAYLTGGCDYTGWD